MRARTLTDEAEAAAKDASGESPASAYSFDGFNVEFSERIMLTPLAAARTAEAKGQSISRQFTLDPDREGTFLIPDIYPDDFKSDPPFHLLPGLMIDSKEVVGCIIKASEGTKWAPIYEDWFKRAWKSLRGIAGSRYGVDFFRGCYHFLQFSQDGTKQADYFCDLVDAAGGWDIGDLMPWVDVEEGGQRSWTSQKLEAIAEPAVRERLAASVTTCTTAFVTRFKQRTGRRIAVYGRGVFRDLQMTDCKFGSDSAINPAYTKSIIRMEQYGVPLDDISLWQISGDKGPDRSSGFPQSLGDWGVHDYSVYIDGPRKTTMKTLRDRCLAK